MSYHETKMYYIEEKQTHDVASRFGNRTTLFILATWTLIDCVAPDQELLVARNYDVSLQHIQLFTLGVIGDDDDHHITSYDIIRYDLSLKVKCT